jgi:hypothetical protein
MFPPIDLQGAGTVGLAAYLARVHDAGRDHVCCGDHVKLLART